jgi:hypothetical protein
VPVEPAGRRSFGPRTPTSRPASIATPATTNAAPTASAIHGTDLHQRPQSGREDDPRDHEHAGECRAEYDADGKSVGASLERRLLAVVAAAELHPDQAGEHHEAARIDRRQETGAEGERHGAGHCTPASRKPARSSAKEGSTTRETILPVAS